MAKGHQRSNRETKKPKKEGPPKPKAGERSPFIGPQLGKPGTKKAK
jgi:hypothetical protein